MNMYGWTTWGRIEDPRESYKEIGPMQLFKHWTGPIVAVPESIPRDEAFLMLAQMNEYLAAVHALEFVTVSDDEHVPEHDWNMPHFFNKGEMVGCPPNCPVELAKHVPCGSDHCTECK